MLTLLLWSSPFIAIAFIVWHYRRQTAMREAASNQRLKQIFNVTTTQESAGVLPSALAPVDAVSMAGVRAQPPMNYALRKRLLTPAQTLLYYLLKTGLPEHEVLAQVSAASVIDVLAGVSSFKRDTHQRRLAGVVLDFVVCDKSFKAVAAVNCVREGSAAEGLAFARTCCEPAGLRWIEIAPDALPRRELVRAVVLGT
jgi:hypothetical protein